MLKAICEGRRDNVVLLVSTQRKLRDGVMALWVEQGRAGASSRTQPSCGHYTKLSLCLLQFLICLGCVCVLFPKSVYTTICHLWLAWGVPSELWFITIFDSLTKGLGDVVAWTAGAVLGDPVGPSQSCVT